MKRLVHTLVACVLACTTILPATTVSVAAANERSLFLYYTHTKETTRIVFKRNGRYVQDGLNQLNVFLRDWRRNEPAKMDPALFDILWEVYQEAGSNQPIHIVSAYRSPATNAMLASNSSGVADNSQHMKGKAIDFYIPGVPASKLREIGFRKQGGGVGYYPSSGSPFVHLDTGSVRAWPRMTTAQLREIFPDGRTLHVPSNGQVLSQEGYRAAQAEWQKCRRVPCNGTSASGSTQTAEAAPRRTLADFFFGGSEQQAQTATAQSAQQQPAPQRQAQPQAQQVQQVAAVEPPSPPVRPADMIAGTQVADAPGEPQDIPFQVIDADQAPLQVAALDAASELAAPTPPAMSRTLAQMRATTPSAYGPSNAGSLAIAAIDSAPTPQPRPDFGAAVVASAFAAPEATARDSGTTSASGLLRPGIAASAAQQTIDAEAIESASAEPNYALEDFADLFKGAIMPVDSAPDSATANAMASIQTREGELFAPDVAHVTEMFLTNEALSSERFAFMTDPDNADFDPTPQPGNGNSEFQFSRTASLGPQATGFGAANTIWVRVQ